mmetsp:Transcript_28942/g.64019  ORF Transcript_28942/g.64019 Transcript_28942/m.64019 type:complete len:248 (-) Transcript_28942:995-1738(-)
MGVLGDPISGCGLAALDTSPPSTLPLPASSGFLASSGLASSDRSALSMMRLLAFMITNVLPASTLIAALAALTVSGACRPAPSSSRLVLMFSAKTLLCGSNSSVLACGSSACALPTLLASILFSALALSLALAFACILAISCMMSLSTFAAVLRDLCPSDLSMPWALAGVCMVVFVVPRTSADAPTSSSMPWYPHILEEICLSCTTSRPAVLSSRDIPLLILVGESATQPGTSPFAVASPNAIAMAN